ncbi:unnamed protein product [Larinioides sclopetarius]|uniref:Uncharacterized protein n=1 Tax=Larinioides sclopetarius TaxID=280406 RepID=A0AAV2C1D5_9ARAC
MSGKMEAKIIAALSNNNHRRWVPLPVISV